MMNIDLHYNCFWLWVFLSLGIFGCWCIYIYICIWLYRYWLLTLAWFLMVLGSWCLASDVQSQIAICRLPKGWDAFNCMGTCMGGAPYIYRGQSGGRGHNFSSMLCFLIHMYKHEWPICQIPPNAVAELT